MVFAKADVIRRNQVCFGSATNPRATDGISLTLAPPKNCRFHTLRLPVIENRTAADDGLLAVFQDDSIRRSVEHLRAGNVETVATNQFQQSFAVERNRIGDRVATSLSIFEQNTREIAAMTVHEPDSRGQFVLVVIGIVPEAVCADDNITRVFHQQVAVMAAVDVIARDGHAAS